MTVELDRIDRRTVPVEVERGDVPTGIEVGMVTVEPAEVEVVGPASVITRVVAARANVIIQSSGIDIDQDVELVPVDNVGDAVAQVDLDPPTARVTIPVFSDRQTRTLPVSPQLIGSPAAGFAISSVEVDPTVVTVDGDGDELEALATIDTEPVSVAGVSAATTVTAALALPTGVVALDVQQVDVTIGVRALTESRNFEVGVRMVGAQADLSYSAGVDRVRDHRRWQPARPRSHQRRDAGRRARRVHARRPARPRCPPPRRCRPVSRWWAISPPTVPVTVTTLSSPAP